MSETVLAERDDLRPAVGDATAVVELGSAPLPPSIRLCVSQTPPAELHRGPSETGAACAPDSALVGVVLTNTLLQS